MAKRGWVAADFPKVRFPAPRVKEWIAERWRHTAGKKLLKAWQQAAAKQR